MRVGAQIVNVGFAGRTQIEMEAPSLLRRPERFNLFNSGALWRLN